MRKELSIFMCLLISAIATGQVDFSKYPDYDTIITKFFQTYSVANLGGTSQLRFEKRPNGWYVAEIDYSRQAQTIKEEKFWDRNENLYKEIDFDKIGIEEDYQVLLDQFSNDGSKELYRICPFYGYPHWDWDVIQEFKDSNNISEYLQYALGRAYSSYASNLIDNNSSLADPEHQFKLPDGKDCMSAEQLQKYRMYRHLAIKEYKKLALRNPNFETIVGTIGTKVSNEYLTAFLDLRIFQNEQEAQSELIDGLFDDFYISLAKNYLNSCAPNAILFTNGDNDTYPLLYVQAKYKFRTDVLVTNISLLQSSRYINSLRHKILEAEGLPLSITSEEISGTKRDLIVFIKADEFSADLKDMISFVRNDEHTKLISGTDYYYMPTDSFRLNEEEKIIEWRIRKNYIYKNQLIMLDLLATNNWLRPVYFAVSIPAEEYLGLDNYLSLEGLAYRIVSSKKERLDDHTGAVNSGVMYTNLITKFVWPGMKNLSTDKKLVGSNYRYNFQRLAQEFINENKLDTARLVLSRCMEILPDENLPYDYLITLFIEDYYKLNEMSAGNKLAVQLLLNLKNGIDNYNGISDEQRSQYRTAVEARLEELAKTYKQNEILKVLEK